MSYSTPNNKRFFQDNKNQFNGNIKETFNIDFKLDRGKVSPTRTKKVSDFVYSVPAGTAEIYAITQGGSIPIVFGVDTTEKGVYRGDTNTFLFSSFSQIALSAPEADSSVSDFTIANGQGYVTTDTSFWHAESNGLLNWTEVSSPALSSGYPHLLTSLGSKVYVTNLDYKVGYINTSNVLTLSGDNTIDLAIAGYTITVFMAGLDRIWIGVSSTSTNQNDKCFIYEWDGASSQVSQQYEIDAPGLLCGVIKDGVPYVVDARGRILTYAGSTFKEVARFPLEDGEHFDGYTSTNLAGRSIHPRGITVDQDEILINVSNRLHNSDNSESYWGNFPSGIWAYSEENGLYHKLSASYQAPGDTGTTNMTDYGQYRVLRGGAIFVQDAATSLQKSGEGGRIVFSQIYFTGSEDTNVTFSDGYNMGLFTDDTKDDTQKYGYIVFSDLISDNIVDTWQKIYVKYKKLINSTDAIVVKYKSEESRPTVISGTWTSSTEFFTTDNISSYAVGDEIQVIQGQGSGKAAHIVTLTDEGGGQTLVKLDEDYANVANSGTFKAYIDNWIKAGSAEYTDGSQYKGFTLSKENTSPILQVKICMQFTGKNRFYGAKIINKNLINE